MGDQKEQNGKRRPAFGDSSIFDGDLEGWESQGGGEEEYLAQTVSFKKEPEDTGSQILHRVLRKIRWTRRKRLLLILSPTLLAIAMAAVAFIPGLLPIREQPVVSQLDDQLSITVDYGKSLREMVKAGGYTSESLGINSNNFPRNDKRGKTRVKVILLPIEDRIRTESILEKATRRGWQPAQIEHLLAVGIQHPKIQEQFPVVALGSILNKEVVHQVAILTSWYQERRLELIAVPARWRETYRFLMITEEEAIEDAP